MKLFVYYDEIDGQLHPKWLLATAFLQDEYANYSVEAPFERFHPEDFHDSMSIITVSQGALLRDPFCLTRFSIHIPTVIHDAVSNGSNIHFNFSHFLILIDELEELLQMNVRQRYMFNSLF
ncbi:hypothetical protein [Bacillus sp. JCM 19034]|uniref:hypothetical protein n=1 Tax=Bacillus sp. JCM 19034 TaxID=1481928 RepID=UPI00078298DE|nr:hypothetical protein [Bacillus sp. JCM 19034]